LRRRRPCDREEHPEYAEHTSGSSFHCGFLAPDFESRRWGAEPTACWDQAN
jgi:hypothetical protein